MNFSQIEKKVELLTATQRLCREAKDTGSRNALLQAQALLSGEVYASLERGIKLNLQAAVRDAFEGVCLHPNGVKFQDEKEAA